MIKKIKNFVFKNGQKKDNTILWIVAISIFLIGALWITTGLIGLFG